MFKRVNHTWLGKCQRLTIIPIFALLLIPSIPIISIMVRMEWYDGRGGSCSPAIRRTLITYALLCILLCPVFCSSLYFTLLYVLLCAVFSLHYILLFFVSYSSFTHIQSNKLAKLGDAIAISKSETMNHSLTH